MADHSIINFTLLKKVGKANVAAFVLLWCVPSKLWPTTWLLWVCGATSTINRRCICHLPALCLWSGYPTSEPNLNWLGRLERQVTWSRNGLWLHRSQNRWKWVQIRLGWRACCKSWNKKLKVPFKMRTNQGFYINEYTTKVHALGDKLMQGLQRIAQKIHASEADGSVEKLTTRSTQQGESQDGVDGHCRSKVARSWCFPCCSIICPSLRIAAGRLIWRWRMPKLYQLGKTISKVVWKLYTKRLQCPKALAFYCRRCKVEELKNYQWAGSYNRSRMIKPCLPMLLPPWNQVEQETGKTMATSTSVRAGNGSHRCNKPCNMRKMTSCGIAWLLTWRPFRSTALITTPTFMCSSHPITKTTCTVESIPSCRQGLESS